MRLKPRTYVGVSAGAYPWIPLDHHLHPFQVSWYLQKTGTGDVSFQLHYTLSDVLDVKTPAATVYPLTAIDAITAPSAGVVTDPTAGVTGAPSFAFPIAAMRLRVVSVSGVAGAVLEVRQAGN